MIDIITTSFGMREFFNTNDFLKLLLRFALNFSCVWVLVRGIHFQRYRDRELAFTYVMLNVITFALCFLLRKVPIELGFALGLFAVFGILRYRTEAIRTRDLTYLFISIGLAVLNAVANKKVSLSELLFIDLTILALTWIMTQVPRFREESYELIYDNLDLLGPNKHTELIADLRQRTGQDVIWVGLGEFDLLRDTVRLTIRCKVKR